MRSVVRNAVPRVGRKLRGETCKERYKYIALPWGLKGEIYGVYRQVSMEQSRLWRAGRPDQNRGAVSGLWYSKKLSCDASYLPTDIVIEAYWIPITVVLVNFCTS